MRLEDLPEQYRNQAERQLKNRAAVPSADMERAACSRQMVQKTDQAMDTCCRIRVHCRRHRLADPDGISVKAVLDGLVLAGILADDSTKQIIESPIITQEKISKNEPETTILTIEKI